MAEGNDSPLESAVTSLSKSIAERLPKNSRVLVAEIADRDGRLTYLGRHFSEELRSALSANPDFTLVKRRRSDLIHHEAFLRNPGLSEPASALKSWESFGADTLIHGNVLDLENAIDLDLLVQSIGTGQILGTVSQRLEKNDELASLLHAILLSERKKNNDKLSESAASQDQDGVRINALENDDEKLREVLRTGIWRGGPAFDEVTAVQPTASAAVRRTDPASDEPPMVRVMPTGTWGFWGSAGYMRAYSESKNTWNVGIGLRTPSGKLESDFDVGFFSGSGLGTVEMENGFNTFARGYRYSTFFYRARGVYVHKLRYINIPSVVKVRFPLTLRFGAGFGIYEIKYTVDEVIRNIPMQDIHSTYRRTEHFQRVEPMLEFGLSKELSNVLDAQLSWEYVFSRGAIGKDSFQYGGPSILLRLSYRFF